MDKPEKIEVVYSSQLTLTTSDKTFTELVKYVMNDKVLKKHEPLKIILEKPKPRILYFDKTAFYGFLKGTITKNELLELCEIEKLYRNTQQLKTDNDIEIDKGSLWKYYNKKLTLIDDDQYITSEFFPDLFEEV